MLTLSILLAALLSVWCLLLFLHWSVARAAWREPVLRFPVLIIESDDWGPGPEPHGQVLADLAACLGRHRDAKGRPAVMTLGLILSVPDGKAIWAGKLDNYHARWLDAPQYEGVLRAVLQGRQDGVFAPQLHGAAHYWPPSLMQAAVRDQRVLSWLRASDHPQTEQLPSHLQSRWTDAPTLPSEPIPPREIRAAVQEETQAYARIFGEPAVVAVPPTFVWNTTVEREWAKAGIRCVITPGRRYEARDADGRPAQASPHIHNGDRGPGGLLYLVRDEYFEPERGHKAEQAMEALARKSEQGRPCLLETHRSNFTGDVSGHALEEMERLLSQARGRYPQVRFTSCAELAEQYRQGGDWTEHRLRPRLQVWARRMLVPTRFRRLASLTGLSWVIRAIAGKTAG